MQPQSSARVVKLGLPRKQVLPLGTMRGRREAEKTESILTSTPVPGKKEPKIEESERKSESITPAPAPATVTTKSGRASKPSTPALATFQEASRSRSSRNVEGTGNKKNGKRVVLQQCRRLLLHPWMTTQPVLMATSMQRSRHIVTAIVSATAKWSHVTQINASANGSTLHAWA
jgi:hypothetical protein